jgi:UDP-galactopyranose mutase
MTYDIIIVGCGYAGSVCARLLAEKSNKRILLLDRRSTIAGNMYDYKNESGILVHKYGPHIPAMNDKNVYDFLSRFTEWTSYEHHVLAEIDGVEIPLPVNFTSIEKLFPSEKARKIKRLLTDKYGADAQVPILTLRKDTDADIKEFAEYIYRKVFYHYTLKMWGKDPDEMDPAVTGRIPVRLSHDDRHFLHAYQVMPKNGYTELFINLLDHPNIEIALDTDALDILKPDFDRHTLLYKNRAFDGHVIYTGAIDELFGFAHGPLPYRSLRFEARTFQEDYVQHSPVLNWPDSRPATRRTEMKRLTGQHIANVTTTITEYPGAYNTKDEHYGEPYYPIIDSENQHLYEKYKNLLADFANISIVGRLAEYKYYNMEAVILAAFELLADKFNIVSLR